MQSVRLLNLYEPVKTQILRHLAGGIDREKGGSSVTCTLERGRVLSRASSWVGWCIRRRATGVKTWRSARGAMLLGRRIRAHKNEICQG